MIPEHLPYINLVELSRELDEIQNPFIHKASDIFTICVNEDIPFYFYLNNINEGGELFSFNNSSNSWELVSDENRIIDDDDLETMKSMNFDEAEILKFMKHKHEAYDNNPPLVKYLHAPNINKYRAYIGKGSFKKQVIKKTLTYQYNETLWIEIPSICVRVNEELYLLKGSSYKTNGRNTFDFDNRTFKKESPKILNNPIVIDCENISVNVKEIRPYFDKIKGKELQALDENVDTPKPSLGDKPSMAVWVKYVVVNECLDTDGNIKRGSQKKIIDMSYTFGYKDGTQVKKAWGALGYSTGNPP